MINDIPTLRYTDIPAMLGPLLEDAKTERDRAREHQRIHADPLSRHDAIAAQARYDAIIECGLAITLGSRVTSTDMHSTREEATYG